MPETDPTGYTKAAEILDTLREPYEQASDLTEVIPSDFRVVEVSNGGGYQIERETEYCPKWVAVARFTEPDAKYEWADEFQQETSGEYRCVVDHSSGEVWLEVKVDE